MQLFVDSYKRVLDNRVRNQDFFEAFYETFLSSSKEVAKKFERTDMMRQRRMLRASFDHMTFFSMDRQATEELRTIARAHSHTQADIKPHLYDTWLDCLVRTVQVFDDKYDDEVETAWRVMLAPGITFMKQKYRDQ